MKGVKLLDCTLRDGAYIVDGNFGDNSIKGIIRKLDEARVDIIECGWLKDSEHKTDSTYFHLPSDLTPYIQNKNKNIIYSVMIDYNRYNDSILSNYDKDTLIDAIRIVFPYGKLDEGLAIGNRIKNKGYKVFYQLANTLKYNNEELVALSKKINECKPDGVYMVDTFGAMYNDDVERIVSILDENISEDIDIGIHTHNNQQLGFSNTIAFLKYLKNSKKNRYAVVDVSLNGMGRGAGNAPTELVTNFLNKKYDKHYNLDAIMDAIDMYMTYYNENYSYGYSTPYAIAGIYCTHVNNISYLLDRHKAVSRDMRNILENMDSEDRLKYDYDLLETKYIENQNVKIDDKNDFESLSLKFKDKNVLLIAPGYSSLKEFDKIKNYISKNNVVIIGVNAIIKEYEDLYDYLFFVNELRLEYAKASYQDIYNKHKKIILSNINIKDEKNSYYINFETVIRRGYEYFDNAVICAMRLLDNLKVNNIFLCGFDGFKEHYNESYADAHIPAYNSIKDVNELNREIKLAYKDFEENRKNIKNITFLTGSIFE